MWAAQEWGATPQELGEVGATIAPGPACIAFAAVVILTMIAEMVFDPKLIWDQKEVK